MFTIEQIKDAHTKLKNGVDFPSYIQELKSLRMRSYIHFVADGHIVYLGDDDQQLNAAVMREPIEIAVQDSTLKLQHALTIHQQEETDYLTFCKQAAYDGVDK